MALVALASARSPGLTTTALALAAVWPAPPGAVLVELDPDGGILAGRLATSPDPGLNSLAASGRHYLSPGLVVEHFQRLPNGIPAILAPPSPDRTVAAVETLNRVGLAGVLRVLPGSDVLVDCGRIDSRSPALAVLRGADAVVFVIRPRVEDVVTLQHRLETLDLGFPARPVGMVVVGTRPYSPEDMATALRLPIMGVIAWDPRAAEALGEGRARASSSKLLRSAGVVAAGIVALLRDAVDSPADQPSTEGATAGVVSPSPVWPSQGTSIASVATGWGALPGGTTP